MSETAHLPSPILQLPALASTEEAIRFGRFMSRPQLIFLAGARAALKREFELAGETIGRLKLQSRIIALDQLRGDLAYRMGLLREAMEAAPDYVRASVIGLGLFEEHAPTLSPTPAPAGEVQEKVKVQDQGGRRPTPIQYFAETTDEPVARPSYLPTSNSHLP